MHTYYHTIVVNQNLDEWIIHCRDKDKAQSIKFKFRNSVLKCYG